MVKRQAERLSLVPHARGMVPRSWQCLPVTGSSPPARGDVPSAFAVAVCSPVPGGRVSGDDPSARRDGAGWCWFTKSDRMTQLWFRECRSWWKWFRTVLYACNDAGYEAYSPRPRGWPPCPLYPRPRGGLLPRPQGWPRSRQVDGAVLHVLSAPAGMAPGWSRSTAVRGRAPRTRGDGPATAGKTVSRGECSPHARGWPLCGGARATFRILLPAPARMAPTPERIMAALPAAPRPRGMTPSAYSTPRRTGSAPARAGMAPPARGWPPGRTRPSETARRRRGAGRSGCHRGHRGLVHRHPTGPARPGSPETRPAQPLGH